MLHNQKISKSRNWYIGLRDFLSAFASDYLRFYIASISSYSQSDINFDWNAFSEKINNELIANIGNFINRALSFVQKIFYGKVPEPSIYDSQDHDSIVEINGIAYEVGLLLSQNELDKALKRILKFGIYFNQYFQKKQPWSKKTTAQTTLFIAVNAVRSMAIILEPFIPFSCEKIWSQLGMHSDIHKQGWLSASQMEVPSGHILGKIEPIFCKIEPSYIEQYKSKLGKLNA